MRIEVAGLVKRYGRVKALDGVSFGFDSGRIYGFVGPNGAGKTTTMQILATLDVPDAGDACVDGVSVCHYPERARRMVGFVPDALPAQRDVTVREYLDFFARAHGIRSPRRREVLEGVEEFTGLAPLRDRDLTGLSKGMKQRVSVARALLHDPAVLVLDEPAAGLDPRARIELRELLKALVARDKAILVSSHILTELGEMCDGAVIIEAGRVIRTGTIEELLSGDAASPTRQIVLRPLARADELCRFLLERPECVTAGVAGATVETELRIDDEGLARLVGDIVAAGYGLLEVRPREADLESVFMRLTKGELQ